MEILYFIENLFLLFIVYALITYISSLVALIHGVRYRLINDKLQSIDDLDNEQLELSINNDKMSNSNQEELQQNEQDLNNLNIIDQSNLEIIQVNEEYNPNYNNNLNNNTNQEFELQNNNLNNIVTNSAISMTPTTVSTPVLGETIHLNNNNNNNNTNMESENPLTKQLVLTSFFYGSCICLNEFEFSTTFTRYVNSKEGKNICNSDNICSLTLLLNEKPQNEFIIKFFTQSRPILSFIVINNTNMVNETINCNFQDLNEIETELVSRYVHTCILTNLNENTIYNFKVGMITINGSEPIYSNLKQFKTFSNNINNNNLNFIQSSEFGYNDNAFNLLKLAITKYNPKFIAISGNLVFDNGFLTCYTRWVKFLERYSSIAIDSNSNLIPLLTTIGNYEALFWKFKANY
ncbi:predicted protein, partial [Naegleria gruberi]